MKQTGTKIVILMMVSFFAVCAYAGDLEPPGGAPVSTMHTLEDIYNKIDAVATLDKALPAKTGQTTSYATGDDGDLEKGVASPEPRFTDNGDGTVTDNLTNLIWLKNANVANAPRNWATALRDIAQLNTDGTINGNNCGDISNGGSHQTDWRLPNLFELESLRNMAYYGPCISNSAGTGQWTAGDPFDNVQSGYYWSGTTCADSTGPGDAWDVDMYAGYVYYCYKKSSATDYVWPMRGGN